jgi:diadenosine tetraphosphate (Ap4A) HIT family hydrolase
VSLETLWAGWRLDYVAAATTGERTGPGDQCVFCRIGADGPPSEDNCVVWKSDTAMAVLNAYPYASGHLLVMPLRHVADLGELTAPERAAMWGALEDGVSAVTRAYDPDGLNMGANFGRAAGAGIPAHLHFHVLPRWSGDTNFMTSVAGVRVMPEALPASWHRLRDAWPDS